MNFEIAVGEQVFKNPLVLASGTFGYGLAYPEVINKVGVMVTKGISVKPKRGNPPPRIWDSLETVVNSVGLENVGLNKFCQSVLPSLKTSTPIFVNLAGVAYDDFEILLKELGADDRVAGFELNLSCPNVKEGGVALGQNPETVESVTALSRSLTAKPLWVKLTSNFCDVRATSIAAEKAGADAVVLVNTLNALIIDLNKKKPFLGAGSGGLSGPALKPHILYIVREVSHKLSIPVIASGGALSGWDVAEYLLAGATMVELGSVNLTDPWAAVRVLKEFESYCVGKGLSSPAELIGKLEEI